MSGRFLISIDKRDRDQRGSDAVTETPEWQCIFQKAPVRIFAEPGTPFILIPDDGGVIIGSIFSRNKSRPISSQDLATMTAQTERAWLGYLIDSCWGAWCAFLTGPSEGNWNVVRDPSVGRPCYFAESDNTVAIASDPELIFCVTGMKPEVDWSYIYGHLANSNLRPSRTGLAGVTELLAGHALTDRLCIEQIWTPWHFAGRRRLIRNRSEACDMLRTTVTDCVGAWVNDHRHILLGVSGGLDSSIVAGCLKAVNANFSCLTVATRDASGDERPFARLLARSLDVPLFERFECVSDVDLVRSSSAHLPRPIARSFSQSSDRHHERVAVDVGATAYMNGGGGDNVFFLANSATPITDRLLLGQFGSSLRTAYDVSRQTEVGLWEAMAAGTRKVFVKDRSYRLKGSRLFLADGMDPISTHHHPWLQVPSDGLPGKAMHIAWLLGIENHLEGYGREIARPVISPLMSQPVVELCLQIPTWQWCAGGINRSVARDAFRDMIPTEIRNRRTKGTPTSFAYEVFDKNFPFIREFLLEGLLCDHGLLDKERLRNWFEAPSAKYGGDQLRLLALADVEAWVRHWHSRSSTYRSLAGV